jgi:hypothetical protein
VDASHNRLVTVTNGGNRPTDALVTLHYDDGKQTYELRQTIQPGEQMWLNFADLIHNRVVDRKGNLLPADLSSGTYDLRDLSPRLGTLVEGSFALERSNAVVCTRRNFDS